MTAAQQPALVKVHRLDDGAVLYKYDDGSWLIDVPALGRHQLIAADSLAPEWPTGGES